MEKMDWSQFKLRVNVNTDIQNAYAKWATPNGLESWFLRNAVFRDKDGNLRDKHDLIQPGDTYEWYWHGYPDSVVEKGTVLEANNRNLFSFTFSLECPVSVSFYEESGETIIELIEKDLPNTQEATFKHYVGDSKGWIFYLTNLKSIMEGGLDLRNRKLDLTNVITS